MKPKNPEGFCHCGCGQKTKVAQRSDKRWGNIKGEHMLFIKGHHRRVQEMTPESRAKISAKVKAWQAENPHPWKGRHHTEEHKAHMRAAYSGADSPNWQGGKSLDSSGYMTIYVGHEHPMADSKGRVREHRLVVAEDIGRMLGPDEAVHHINGIKTDNSIENLKLTDWSAHARWHGMRVDISRLQTIRELIEEGCTNEEIAERLHLARFLKT